MPKSSKKQPEEHGDKRQDVKRLFYRKLAETHLFFEVGKVIGSELEPSELIQKIIEAIRTLVPFENVSAYLSRRDLSGLTPAFSFGPLFEGVVLEPIYLDNGAPGVMAASGEPLYLTNTATFEDFLHFPAERGRDGSFIGVVLNSDSRVIGTIGFGRAEAGAFRVEDFDILRIISPLISAGLEKAELFMKTLELARVDELTGLYNYRVMKEKLDEEMRRRARSGRDFSFIMIDIDDFKRVNDRYGHLEGSRLLAQLGPLIRASCRAGSLDICFRYGGEEFSVLLPETKIGDAQGVAERIRQAVEGYPFTFKALHPDEQLTISLGVSAMGESRDKAVSDLIHEADVALYRAKGAGKNKVVVFRSGDTIPGGGPQGT